MNPSFQQVYSELAEEHRELMSLVERIRAHGEVVGLGPLLEQLHALLIRHFSHEQFPGGLYDCMGAHDARYHDELKTLIEEHCTILSSVRGLLELTRIGRESDVATLLDEVSQVLQRLDEHEHREHALADRLMASERVP
ncbi:MAG: hypothetical protein GTO67_02765 [Gammaproteobacteria bacterium]|nr:hypothetical protein [Gammaproteobacteria bacterium]NIM72598.1 hypothetical protein [Gammaproteobacteria bacterium]NIN37655.1 hypothetical protein [Gammaproteobacteria bacterium]NIO24359.1 hypothetical protein [Gammaproteobacteria bacterium]NIO64962.1 hypothetical protein [Gammaproteobacteria bacterium]